MTEDEKKQQKKEKNMTAEITDKPTEKKSLIEKSLAGEENSDENEGLEEENKMMNEEELLKAIQDNLDSKKNNRRKI